LISLSLLVLVEFFEHRVFGELVWLDTSQGQLYHYVPELKPKDDERPKYLQLFFFDAQNKLQNQAAIVQELRLDIAVILINVVKENPCKRFVKLLQAFVTKHRTQIVINHSTIPKPN